MFIFWDDDFEAEATVLDVATTGCSTESAIDVTVGMILTLSLFLPDYQWPLRVDQALVWWVEGQQFGLEFTSIRLAQRERLRVLIMLACP